MKSISVSFKKDYRTFKADQKVVMEFDNNIAVLMGINGSGKTSLVNLLYSALNTEKKSYDWFFDDVPSDVCEVDISIGDSIMEKVLRFDSDKMNPKGQAMADMSAFLELGGVHARGSSGQNSITLFNKVIGAPEDVSNSIVLFDEPFRNLDIPHKMIVTSMIEKIAKKNICLVITHDYEQAGVISPHHVMHIPSGDKVDILKIKDRLIHDVRQQYFKSTK